MDGWREGGEGALIGEAESDVDVIQKFGWIGKRAGVEEGAMGWGIGDRAKGGGAGNNVRTPSFPRLRTQRGGRPTSNSPL